MMILHLIDNILDLIKNWLNYIIGDLERFLVYIYIFMYVLLYNW